MVGIGTVQLNPSNPRLNEAAVMPVADSIRRFGFRVPIVVNRRTNIIEAGNTRWKAAKKLGMEEIPVVFVEDDDVTAAAYGIADNRTGEIAEWDEPALATILSSLQDVGQLDMTGYGAEDLGELIAGLQAGQEPKEEGAIPEPQEGPTRVQPGEVWACGKHRVMCGDSTDGDAVALLMDGMLAQLVFTDPPYGVGYDGGTVVREKLQGDDSTDLYVPACQMAADFSDDEAPLYLWHAGVKGIAAAAAGYEIRCEIVWNKNLAQFGALSAQYKQKHEPLYYCFKRGVPPRWFGPTNEVTVWDCDRAAVNEFHPTQKPPELAVRAIRNSTVGGGIVLDLFLGSGSTLIAAEQTGRVCYGLEILPRYADVILARWEQFTDQQAERVHV